MFIRLQNAVLGYALLSLLVVPAASAPVREASKTKMAPKPAIKTLTSKKPVPKPTAKKASAGLLVQGQIQAITRPPRPKASPYDDAIISLHLTNVKGLRGKLAAREIVVFLWGMRDNKWTRAASLRVGQPLTLSLQPWEKVEKEYGGYHRIDIEDESLFRLDPYWAEIAPSRG